MPVELANEDAANTLPSVSSLEPVYPRPRIGWPVLRRERVFASPPELVRNLLPNAPKIEPALDEALEPDRARLSAPKSDDPRLHDGDSERKLSE